jgi:glucose-6-phosphate isomerase
MTNIGDKRKRLLAKEHAHPSVSLGKYLPDVESAVTRLQEQNVVSRIWRKDHTVWKPDPTEITDRLGWLKATDTMRDQVTALQALAQEVRDTGYRHTVLLGMGGSSLGPEVLRQTFGSAPGYPELIVMDTTVPAWVQAITKAIDPAHALFLISSKSGGTVETLSGYSYLRDLVEQAVGAEQASAGFIAITDPGTPLEKMAQENRFRRIFLNPLDIAGRYSVLSYFGLVPAALAGIDITTLIDRADRMRESCASSVAAHDNPGAYLGAILGTLAQKGRDKATLVTSPAINSFGLWAEQLLAESTGKEGTGIIPVAGEPLMDPAAYGDDRLFIYLRLEGDDNSATDEALDQIQAAGQPVVRLELQDQYDLGAEFFRWEFATSVAGALLGIHPFNQPNVQSAKDKTTAVLQSYQSTALLPGKDASDSLHNLLDKARPGDYLAIMAYLKPTPEVDHALNALRKRVVERYRIATTLGYGPRFLHSTGQLHKGGPDTGLFLQIMTEHREDIPIPGELYGFATLAQAQALGDIQVLAALGRRVARVHIDTGVEAYIHALARSLA